MKRSRAEIARIKWEMLDVWLINPKITNGEMAHRFGLDDHTVAKYKSQWLEIFDKWQQTIEKKVTEHVEQVEKKVGIWEGVWQTITGKK